MRSVVRSPQELRDVGRRTQSWTPPTAQSTVGGVFMLTETMGTTHVGHDLWQHQSPRAAAVPPSRGARAAEEEKSPNSCPAAASAAPRPLSNGSDDPRDRGAIRWMFDFFLLGVYSPLRLALRGRWDLAGRRVCALFMIHFHFGASAIAVAAQVQVAF